MHEVKGTVRKFHGPIHEKAQWVGGDLRQRGTCSPAYLYAPQSATIAVPGDSRLGHRDPRCTSGGVPTAETRFRLMIFNAGSYATENYCIVFC